MKIVIDARVSFGMSGGISQALVSLAAGLSANASDHQFIFIVRDQDSGWLDPWLSGNLKRITAPAADVTGINVESRAFLSRIPGYFDHPKVAEAYHDNAEVLVPVTNGLPEMLGADLVHFSFQSAHLTRLPSVYCPHDLQHLFFPENFNPGVHATREVSYRLFSTSANKVVVHTEATRRDVIDCYGLDEDKVVAIPHSSYISHVPELSREDTAALLARFGLTAGNFFLYPSNFWPHKNHRLILRAMANIVKSGGRPPQVVFTGPKKATGVHRDTQKMIARFGQKYGLDAYITQTGFLEHTEIKAMYQKARGVLIPSKFEGFGIPVVDAFEAGVPVMVADASCLPEVMGDAGLVFDADRPAELAQKMLQLSKDDALHRRLVKAGRDRRSQFDPAGIGQRYIQLWESIVDSGKSSNA